MLLNVTGYFLSVNDVQVCGYNIRHLKTCHRLNISSYVTGNGHLGGKGLKTLRKGRERERVA